MNAADVRFSLPTISNDSPALAETSLYHDFILSLHEDDWRQTEFLPAQLLPLIEKEMKAINTILQKVAGQPFTGYDTIHVRKVEPGQLSIPFDHFCEHIDVLEKGAVTFAFGGEQGFVMNGFALRSPNCTYYGTISEGIIKELCVHGSAEIKDEYQHITTLYQLVLVNWCSGQILH